MHILRPAGVAGIAPAHGARVGLSRLALIAAAAQLAAQAPQGLRVVPVVRGDHLVVNFELRDGLTPDVRAAIDSGLKTIFTYTVESASGRPGCGWTGRWHGGRHQQRQVRQSAAQAHARAARRRPERIGRTTTRTSAMVRQWMTNLEGSAALQHAAPATQSRVLRARQRHPPVRATGRSCGRSAAAPPPRRSSSSSAECSAPFPSCSSASARIITSLIRVSPFPCISR